MHRGFPKLYRKGLFTSRAELFRLIELLEEHGHELRELYSKILDDEHEPDTEFS